MGKFYSRSTCPLPNSLLQSTDDQERSAGNNTTINPCDESTSAINGENNKNPVEKWCYCQGVEEEGRPMIYCDNNYCPISCLHFDCLGPNKILSGDWYCPDCRKLKQFKKGKKDEKAIIQTNRECTLLPGDPKKYSCLTKHETMAFCFII